MVHDPGQLKAENASAMLAKGQVFEDFVRANFQSFEGRQPTFPLKIHSPRMEFKKETIDASETLKQSYLKGIRIIFDRDSADARYSRELPNATIAHVRVFCEMAFGVFVAAGRASHSFLMHCICSSGIAIAKFCLGDIICPSLRNAGFSGQTLFTSVCSPTCWTIQLQESRTICCH
jgi:hypothetical protein